MMRVGLQRISTVKKITSAVLVAAFIYGFGNGFYEFNVVLVSQRQTLNEGGKENKAKTINHTSVASSSIAEQPQQLLLLTHKNNEEYHQPNHVTGPKPPEFEIKNNSIIPAVEENIAANSNNTHTIHNNESIDDPESLLKLKNLSLISVTRQQPQYYDPTLNSNDDIMEDPGNFINDRNHSLLEDAADRSSATIENGTMNLDKFNEQKKQNISIAFVGDSTTRHQYLTMLYYLHSNQTGWPNNSLATPNILEGGYPSRLAMKEGMYQFFNGQEKCNCYTPEGKYQTKKKIQQIYENRYYFDDSSQHYVSFILKYGFFSAKGHWDPTQIYSNLTYRQSLVDNEHIKGYVWNNYNWTTVIKQHLASMKPKPKYVIFNAGIWGHDLNSSETLQEIRHALDETSTIGIYRTTIKTRIEKTPQLRDHDRLACQIIHYCQDVSWTFNASVEEYRDVNHFRPKVNGQMGNQLWQLIEKIDTIVEQETKIL